MRKTSMLLMSDYYKQAHAEQYPKGITKLVSYATARMCRLPGVDFMPVFGIQAFVKDFLIERFNETFFNLTEEEAISDYMEIMEHTFPMKHVNVEKFRELHRLGYLPVKVSCLAEGTLVPIRNAFGLPEDQCQVPFLKIENTHPKFPWVVEFLESVTSSEVWYPCTITGQALKYRKIVNEWYHKTGCDMNTAKSAIAEFGFRGGEGSSAATLASAAFLTSFNKTATIPAIKYLKDYYNGNIENGGIASGMLSTEHSVMCSNYAIDGDEETFLLRLFTEIYPTGALSVVMDSYDYWKNLSSCGKGRLRDAVMNREGTVFFRGDSGDPVDIICGYIPYKYKSLQERIWTRSFGDNLIYAEDENCWYKFRKQNGKDSWDRYDTEPLEVMGTVQLLWEMFGGTINEAGYKVLDSHVRAIYGDSITPVRAQKIYERLADKGFAACNVALGAGSFSTQCAEESGELYPFTRDTYGIAVKATYAEDVNGNKYQLFKNPKTDTGRFKKSQKGLIYVTTEKNENGDDVIIAKDKFDSDTIPSDNLLIDIFENGKMLKEITLDDVRNRLHNMNF